MRQRDIHVYICVFFKTEDNVYMYIYIYIYIIYLVPLTPLSSVAPSDSREKSHLLKSRMGVPFGRKSLKVFQKFLMKISSLLQVV